MLRIFSILLRIVSPFLFVLINSFFCLADGEIKLTADKVDYLGQEQKILIAKGKVLIERLGEKLNSDEIIYNIETNEVQAIGNIVLKDAKGNISYADKLIISGDFKQAVISALKLKTTSGETVTAQEGLKLDDNHFQLNNAYYTPCTICGDEPSKWSFKASSATLDTEKKEMEYKNARFYIGRLPLLYFPYFTHSIKGAERKSGILRLNAGRNSNLGNFVKIPYYLNLSPERDATITLVATNLAGPILESEYRHLTDYGQFNANVIYTKPRLNNKKTRDFSGKSRYNIKSHGNFAFNQEVFLNYNINYTSDQNFLRTYGYNTADYTKSNITAAYYDHYNSLKVETLYFQNLRYGQLKDCNPVIAPHLTTYYETNIGADDTIQFYNKSDYLYLHQNSSHSVNRFSIHNGLKKQYITENGHHFFFKTNLRTDLYYYYLNKPLPNKLTESDQNRVIPQFITEWHYPNFTKLNNNLIIIEPLAQLKISPSTNYNKNILNQDSQDSELDFSNLFAENKFTGIDLVERGSRISYGFNSQATLPKNTDLGFLIGQSYSTSKYPNANLDNADYNSKLSHYVGLANLNYDATYIAFYKFKLDRKKLSLLSNEIGVEYRKPTYYFVAEYVTFKDSYNLENLLTIGRKEINFEIGTSYIENWKFSLKTRNNLNKEYSNNFKRGLLNLETNVTYFYDCLGYKIKVYRDFTTPVGTKPSSGFTFGLILKNIN